MAELLRDPWLGKTIEQELGDVLDWLSKSDENKFQVTGRVGNVTFEDDGSNLRIRSMRPRVVQIEKFMRSNEPLEASLSDGVNRINATISNEAAQWYFNQHQRKLTQGTMGGLIQLLDFEIVATHLGPRRNRMRLFITKFKPLGSNGSGLYGREAPQAVEDRSHISMLIQKLRDYREQEAAKSGAYSSQQIPGKASTPSSRFNYDPLENPDQDSQIMFATQAPPLSVYSSVSVKPKPFNNGTTISPRASKVIVNAPLSRDAPGLGNSRGEIGNNSRNQSAAPPTPQKTATTGRKPPSSTHDDLLSILKQAESAQIPNIKSVPDASGSAQLTAVPSKNLPVPHGTTPKERSPSPTADKTPERQLEASSISSHCEMPLERDATVLDAKTTRRESSVNCSIRRPSNRISRREVKISKDQEALLNSRDSWLPAEPGRREPSANVPISILQSLNHKADTRARKFASSHDKSNQSYPLGKTQGAHSPVSSVDEKSIPSQSDTDSPISTSEWPPSPQRSELPPDSSVESADMRASAAVQLQRSSYPPFPPQSIRSRQPSPSRLSTKSPESLHGNNSPIRSQAGSPQSQSRAATPESVGSRLSRTNVVLPCQDHLDIPCKKVFEYGSLRPHSQDSKFSKIHEQGLQTSTPNAAPALEPEPLTALQSTAIEAKEFNRRRKSSTTYSIPSSPTSDLEMTIPQPLDTSLATQGISSIASQPPEPFTQVKRTPYVNGQKHDLSSPRSECLPSPSHLGFPKSPPNGSLSEEVDHVTQSAPSVMETSSADLPLDKPRVNTSWGDKPSAEVRLQASSDAGQPVWDLCLDKDGCDSPMSGYTGERVNKPTAMETIFPASMNAKKDLILPDANYDTHNGAHDEHQAKRKVSDLKFLCSNVSKRRKKSKLPTVFAYTEDMAERPDPKEGAKRYRQGFLASRNTNGAAALNGDSTTPPHPINKVMDANKAGIDQEYLRHSPATSSISCSDDRATANPLADSLDFVKGDQVMDICLTSPRLETKESKASQLCQDLGVVSRRSVLEEDLPSKAVPDDTRPGARDNDSIDINATIVDEDNIDANRANVTGLELTSADEESNLDTRFMKRTSNRQDSLMNGTSLIMSQHDTTLHSPSQKDKRGEAENYGQKFPIQIIKDSVDPPIETDRSMEGTQSMNLSPSSPEPYPDKAARHTQPHQLEKASSPEIPISDTNPPNPAITTSTPNVDLDSNQKSPSLYERFKVAYPVYPGDQKHFTAICKRISNLLSRNRMEHHSLWDDFIIRHKIEYLQYIQRCAESAEDPQPYEDFYRNEIEEPLYNKRLVTRKTLGEVVSLIKHDTIPSVERPGPEQVHAEIERSIPSLHPERISIKSETPSQPRVTIDLTEPENQVEGHNSSEAEPPFPLVNSVGNSRTKNSRRSLPWTRQGDDLDSRPDFPRGSEGPPRYVHLEGPNSPKHLRPNIHAEKNQRSLGGSANHASRSTTENFEAARNHLFHRRNMKSGHWEKSSRGGGGLQKTLETLNPHSPVIMPADHGNVDESSGWWQDDSTPFKSFAKAYRSIRPGNGNSFAKPNATRAEADRQSKIRSNARQRKRINFLEWEI